MEPKVMNLYEREARSQTCRATPRRWWNPGKRGVADELLRGKPTKICRLLSAWQKKRFFWDFICSSDSWRRRHSLKNKSNSEIFKVTFRFVQDVSRIHAKWKIQLPVTHTLPIIRCMMFALAKLCRLQVGEGKPSEKMCEIVGAQDIFIFMLMWRGPGTPDALVIAMHAWPVGQK